MVSVWALIMGASYMTPRYRLLAIVLAVLFVCYLFYAY